jgi:pimeloyl-ACP methyl ester carboxylesterase
MARVLLIPGLLCDAHVWAGVWAGALAVTEADVADVTLHASIPDMAADLLDRHPGPLLIAGHSMGGRVAMEMARRAPDRIAGMALLNTGIHPRRDGEEAKRQALIDLAWRDGMAELARVWLPPMLSQDRAPDPDVLAGLTAMVCRMTPEIHERQMRALLNRPDAAASVARYTGPLALIAARHDAWSPVSQHQDIARLCPQARLTVIEDAGHFAPVEQPDAVADALLAWLKECTA